MMNEDTTLEPDSITMVTSANGSQRRRDMKKKDPMSHRIIEKRRRDRMNNCLVDLSKLIPSHYMKKGRGRVEKTEIIEMAIKYMKQLMENQEQQQQHQNNNDNMSVLLSEEEKKKYFDFGFRQCILRLSHHMDDLATSSPPMQQSQLIQGSLQSLQSQRHQQVILSSSAAASQSSPLSSAPIAHIAPQPNQNPPKQLDLKCSFKSFKKGIKDRFQRGTDIS